MDYDNKNSTIEFNYAGKVVLWDTTFLPLSSEFPDSVFRRKGKVDFSGDEPVMAQDGQSNKWVSFVKFEVFFLLSK